MENIQQLKGFLLSSTIRKKVLKSLEKKPLRQTPIANKLKKPQQNISLILYELEKKKLVECLTPEKKAWKVYEITSLGKEILKKIK